VQIPIQGSLSEGDTLRIDTERIMLQRPMDPISSDLDAVLLNGVEVDRSPTRQGRLLV
jgi:hypothetical protein